MFTLIHLIGSKSLKQQTHSFDKTQQDASDNCRSDDSRLSTSHGQNSARSRSAHDRIPWIFFLSNANQTAVDDGKKSTPDGKTATQNGSTGGNRSQRAVHSSTKSDRSIAKSFDTLKDGSTDGTHGKGTATIVNNSPGARKRKM